MIAIILRFFCKLIFRVEVNGLENVPQEDGLLIVANHQSFLDGLLLGLFIPKRATFIVHTGVLKNVFFRQFLRLTPHYAVNPTSPFAMKHVLRRLKAGENVVIFPEGRITTTGKLMKVYEGPSFVAAKTGAKILPVRVEGAAQSYFGRLSNKHPRKIFPKVTLTVMPTTQIAIDEPADGTRMRAREKRKIAAESMRGIMQNMIFQTEKSRAFYEAFLDAVDKFGAKTKIIEDLNEVEETYQDIIKKSMALGKLASKVSAENEAVGVLMPNVNNTVALLLGMSAFKRIPALLNYTAGSAGIQNACVASNVKTIITSRQFLVKAKLEETVESLEGINLVYLEDLKKQFGLLDKVWLITYAMRAPRRVMKSANPEDPAVILFTSGSEGKPKGVVHSHKSILANVAQIMAMLDFNPTDKFMMVLPIFHAFGFTGTLVPLFNGIKVLVFPSPLQYKVIPEVIYDKGCTVFFATNTFLANYGKFAHPYDFNKLRIVVAGAEKLNDEVRKQYQDKFGVRILEGYGTTECAPMVSANTLMANLSGSVGQLAPGMEYKLTEVPGIEGGGLLHVKGDNTMMGYYLYDNPGVLVPPEDGWYETGDIVSVDKEGFIHILGRVKRFAKIAGEMVSLEAVEKIANTASPDHSHAASSQEDAKRGENIILFTTDPALERNALKAVATELGSPEIAIPRKVIHVEEVPLLGTGKTDYVQLKEMARTA